MADDLARAYAFLARADMAGERQEQSSVGVAVFDDAVPRRLDSNFLHVKCEADGETVRFEAERLGRRMIHVPDSELGERLAPYFRDLHWKVNRVVVMAQRRKPEREADLSLVSEVDEPALRSARHQVVTGQPWARPEVMAQLFSGKQLIGQRVKARFFAVVVDA